MKAEPHWLRSFFVPSNAPALASAFHANTKRYGIYSRLNREVPDASRDGRAAGKFCIQSLLDGHQVAGITRVSPLIRITNVLKLHEGGSSGPAHKIPQSTDYAPIVLERGISSDTAFEQWSNQVLAGGSFHKNITLEVLNEAGTVMLRYEVFQCWPSEYQALPQLNASEDLIAVEHLTLQNEGWQRIATL